MNEEVKNEKLIGFFSLFKNSFDLFFDHFKIIFFLMIIPFVLSIIEFFSIDKINSFEGQKGFDLLTIIVSLMSILFYSFKILLSMGFFLSLENKDKNLKESIIYIFKNKTKLFLSTGIIYLSFLIGGVFFLLIPTIYFSFSFFAFIFIIILENEKGLKALFKSSEYVRGKWGKVANRLAFLGITIFLFIVAFSLILDIFNSDLIGNIFSIAISSFFLSPLSLIFSYLLYKDLKRMKGDFNFQLSKKQKTTSAFFIILSLVVIILLLIFNFKIAPNLSLNMVQFK